MGFAQRGVGDEPSQDSNGPDRHAGATVVLMMTIAKMTTMMMTLMLVTLMMMTLMMVTSMMMTLMMMILMTTAYPSFLVLVRI